MGEGGKESGQVGRRESDSGKGHLPYSDFIRHSDFGALAARIETGHTPVDGGEGTLFKI